MSYDNSKEWRKMAIGEERVGPNQTLEKVNKTYN